MSEVRDLTHWTNWSDGELIDQAAGACQDRALLECDYVREAIALNIIAPFRQKLTTLRAENELMGEAVKVADDAINEMFRYFDGGETRGSYDGKPERAQLRKAGHVTRNALAQVAK